MPRSRVSCRPPSCRDRRRSNEEPHEAHVALSAAAIAAAAVLRFGRAGAGGRYLDDGKGQGRAAADRGLRDELIEDDAVPGMAIAIVYKDEVVYLKGFGVRAKGTTDPVDADTVFQLASFSKPMARRRSSLRSSAGDDHAGTAVSPTSIPVSSSTTPIRPRR